MKWLALAAGFALGVLVVGAWVNRYTLVPVTSNNLGYVLRVDRWTGQADYWVADSSVWRTVLQE